MEIKKVSQYKNGTKIVIIPKKSEISEGDYVMIVRVESPFVDQINQEEVHSQ